MVTLLKRYNDLTKYLVNVSVRFGTRWSSARGQESLQIPPVDYVNEHEEHSGS